MSLYGPALISSPGLLTPPPSPRRRRRLLRASGVSEGAQSIEQYLYNCDAYRATSLPNPLPLPLEMTPAPHLESEIIPLRDSIRQILNEHGFSQDVSFMPYGATKPEYPGGDVPVNLLCVIISRNSRAPAQLGPTKTALYKLLCSNSIDHIHVDIRNVDYAFSPSLFPVLPQERTVLAFEQARDDILRLLGETLGHQWRLVSVFQVGRTESTALPSVVVMVNPSTCADWHILREGIQVYLRLEPSDEVDVEFLPGALSLLQGPGISLVGDVDREALPIMGSSIGISGDVNAGTFGGYMMLKYDDTNSKGFITSYHVVRRPTNPGDTTNLDRLGLAPSDTPEDDIQIQFPSQIDFEESTRDVTQRIQNLEHELDLCRGQQSEREMVGSRVPPRITNAIEDAEDMLSQRREFVGVLGNLPQNVGTVLCTSGKAVLGRRIMDWAFVQLPDNGAKFTFENRMFEVPESAKPTKFGAELPVARPGTMVSEFGPLVKGGYYIKKGRCTGVTAGVSNGALACCQWSDFQRTGYDHRGRPVDIATITEEYVLLNKRKTQLDHEQESFAEHGDSGSFVLDRHGRMCGLLYGATFGHYGPPGQTHFYAHAGLVTSANDLTASVKIKAMKRDGDGKLTSGPAVLSLPA